MAFTSKNVQRVRERRKAVVEAAEAVMQLAKDENRDLSAAETVNFDALIAHSDSLRAEIERLEKGFHVGSPIHTLGPYGNRGSLSGPDDERDGDNKLPDGVRPTPKWAQLASTDLDDGGFNSLGDFVRSIRAARSGEGMTANLSASVNSDPDGGFTMPMRFHSDVMMGADLAAPWLERRMSFIVDAGQGDTVAIPILQDRDRSTNEVGGLKLTRTAAGQTLSTDNPVFARIELKLSKAACEVAVDNELFSGATGPFGAILNKVFSRAVAYLQTKDYLRGVGVGEPQGILNAADRYETAAKGGQSVDTVIYENIVAMMARLDPAEWDNGVWLAHPSVYPELATMVLNVGTGGNAIFVGNAAVQAPQSLLGRPLHLTEHASLVGDVGDICLSNPSSYVYAMQAGGVVIDTSPHARWTTDQTSFRVRLRDDGRPWRTGTLVDAQNYETANHVTLAAR